VIVPRRVTALLAATIVVARPDIQDPSDELTWVDAAGLTNDGRALLDLIAASADEGLDPASYDYVTLGGFVDDLESGVAASSDVDQALWAAATAYATDRFEGRVRPRLVQRTWLPEARAFHARAVVEDALREGRFPEALSDLDPPYRAFARLRAELRRLIRTVPWADVPNGPTLYPGDAASLERLSAIAERIEAESGLEIEQLHDATYDEPLVSAVKRFQAQYGLVSDGIVGSETIKALRTTPRMLADTIAVNMDRWRWMPQERPTREIRVNVPAYEVELVEDDMVVGSMRAIVGRRDWPTPPFRDVVHGIVLNPDWHVPTSIVVREIAPEARDDPEVARPYVITTIADGVERPVDPEAIDWETTDATAVRLRQPAGEANPLGSIKVLLGNDLGIYLHGTPEVALFEQFPRAFSHGCVRVENPLDLATFVTGLTNEELSRAIATGRTVDLPASDRITVTVAYWTAWIDVAGELRFAPDLYGYDERMERAWLR
jgi:murein L,D-transpeptidase YcbB/YkuD